MRRHRPLPRRLASLALLVVAAATPAAAQVIGQGFELERQGKYAQAAAVYLGTVRAEPANLAALLGLERVLPQLLRLPELLPLVQRARQIDSTSGPLRALEIRTYSVLGEPDSAAAAAQRWIAAAPGEEAPWREWAVALEDQRDYDGARRVLDAGRRALGKPTALAFEEADLGQRTNDWARAAAEWGRAVTATPPQVLNAVSQLEPAPVDQRDRVIRALTMGDASMPARRVAADLLLGWDQPLVAWSVLVNALGDDPREAVNALREFADRAAASPNPLDRRVRGLALSELAGRVPAPLATRMRADAARAFLDAGDRSAAQAELARVAADPTAPADAQAMAQASLLDVLILDGKLDSAAIRLGNVGDRLSGEDRARLRLALARARIAKEGAAAGALAQADSALAGDSSVDAEALRGWIALYRGQLSEAADHFRHAGPYAEGRDAATRRAEMLALLQQIGADRSPELGAALRLLARGDSAAAVVALQRVADLIPPRGRPDVLLLAGRVAAAQDTGRIQASQQTAARLFEEVVRTGGNGAAAPAAELAWAQLLLRQGPLHVTEAVAHLEHLILTYPTSAVVPEARRELERAKGAIPKS